MNKKIIIGIAVIVVVVIGVGVFWELRPSGLNSTPQITNSLQASSTNSSASTTIRVPIDFFSTSVPLSNLPMYTNTSTGAVISFNNFAPQAHYATEDIYLNGKDIGQIAGSLMVPFGFSPDNHYFVFRTEQSGGCCDERFTIHVVGLSNATSSDISIVSPRQEGDWKQDGVNYPTVPSTYIEPYKWNGGTLQVIFYYIAGSGSQFDRISPKELWNYDLRSKQYTFVQTLPEGSSTQE